MGLNTDLLKQLATVDGLLAGFSLAAAVRFIADPEERWQTAVATACLLFASLVFVTTSFLAVLLLGQPSPTSPPPIAISLTKLFVGLSLFGLLPFLAGIVSIAWASTRVTRVIITVAAGLSFLLVVGFWLATP